MAYTTLALVQDEVGGSDKLLQLTDVDGVGVVNTAKVDAAIAEADGEINAALGKRYGVPLPTWAQPSVQMLSTRWAARVLRRRAPLPDDIDQQKADRQWLNDVRDGKNSLGVTPSPPGHPDYQTDKAGQRSNLKDVSRNKLKGMW